MTDTLNLKPCPFCGGEAKLRGTKEYNDWYVECPRCHISTLPTSEDNEPEELWNKRNEVKRGEMPSQTLNQAIRDSISKHCNGFVETDALANYILDDIKQFIPTNENEDGK